MLNQEVIGHFRDEAGNEAVQRSAPSRLTIHAPPVSVTVDPPTSNGPDAISLSWSRAAEGTLFARYRIYRGNAPGLDTLRTRKVVTEITDAATTTAIDNSGLEPRHTYYYRVELVDQLGSAALSENEVSMTPAVPPSPDPVQLEPPYGVTERVVNLRWSQTYATGFGEYRIVRGLSPNVP